VHNTKKIINAHALYQNNQLCRHIAPDFFSS
jgi:hypothetical protein